MLDIIVVLFLIFAMWQGARRGFVSAFVDSLGWVVAVILAFVWFASAQDLVREKTNFYSFLYGKISDKVGIRLEEEAISGLPSIVSDSVTSAANDLSATFAESLTNAAFVILVFLALVLVLRALLGIVSSLIGNLSESEGVLGLINRTAGVAIGLLQGIILLFILLAALVPFIGIGAENTIFVLLGKSPFTFFLYEHNLIFLVIKSFL